MSRRTAQTSAAVPPRDGRVLFLGKQPPRIHASGMAAKPELIAHRGYPRHFPENSIAGIEAAIAAGARYIEVDVQLTADEVPVLFHDRTLDRVCGVAGDIAGYRLKELAAFSAPEPAQAGDRLSGARIATLEKLARLMRQYPEIHFFIELKRAGIECHGRAIVLERTEQILATLKDQCTLISFDADILLLAKKRRWRIGLIAEGIQHRIQGLNPSFIFRDVEELPESGDLHISGARLAVYEVADPKQALALAARGVDMVETFAIGEMRQALADHRS